MKPVGPVTRSLLPTAGTTNSTPLPRRGDVINYVFLFSSERQQGLSEGSKARPVLVLSVNEQTRKVYVAPITTKGEDPAQIGASLPLPIDVARAMKLPAAERSSLIPGELNSFEWVGYDLRPRGPKQDHNFGRCPPGFLARALEAAGLRKPSSDPTEHLQANKDGASQSDDPAD